MSDKITFSFGDNWKDYNRRVTPKQIEFAKQDVLRWIGREAIVGKKVVDVGCGSGIHSLAFYQLGASEILSIDVDALSVEATMQYWEANGKPTTWRVVQGSILDRNFVMNLGVWDIVYSWGVLHHTGQMWNAVETASSLVRAGGLLLIGLYSKGPHYQDHLRLKQRYNASGPLVKKWMVQKAILRKMLRRLKERKNPLGWNEEKSRGMNTYHDIIDWLGGLPYEVASLEEVKAFLTPKGFDLIRYNIQGEGGVSVYLLSKMSS